MRRYLCVTACVFMLGTGAVAQDEPELQLRVDVHRGFAPLKIETSSWLRGGDNAHPDFYCLKAIWIWGDGTQSERTPDCDPYDPDTAQMIRHYDISHTYQWKGDFMVTVVLLQGTVIRAKATTVVHAI